MQQVRELTRRQAPFSKPQSIAFDGKSLWVGSIATNKIYQLDPDSWSILGETNAPGKPWGMTATEGELRVLCGETSEDNRIISRFIPGSGFTRDGALACPDDTGSQLGFDGTRLYVSQWYNKRILEFDNTGVHDVIDVPHEICGQVIVDGTFYLVTTDDEDTENYLLTRITTTDGKRELEDIARIPFAARALTWDGLQFWTNHRERDQIIAFAMPLA